ncbi:MAG: LexA family transcriptional regulator [Bacteroidia bacterium]|nr:LexA family transcriptional regulator [Bacteroidia bacterium]
MSDKEKLIIGKNLKHLRRIKNFTQQELADELGIRRSNIGAYEEGRAAPRYDALEKISHFFGISIDLLVKEDLSQYSESQLSDRDSQVKVDVEGKKIRVLATTIDRTGRENIEFVPLKASAGYLNGFADPEYIEDLPKFQLPMLSGPGTYRAFEIKGDSMLPLKSGTVVIGEFVQDWRDIKDGHTYVIVSNSEGVVYKRVSTRQFRDEVKLILKSDNTAYTPTELDIKEVREIWKAKMFMTDQFPEPDMSMEKMSSMLLEIQQELIRLKGQRPE